MSGHVTTPSYFISFVKLGDREKVAGLAYNPSRTSMSRQVEVISNRGVDEEEEKEQQLEIGPRVLEAFERTKDRKKPPISALLTDVYDSMPAHLERQAAHMRRHVNRYSEHYPVQDFLDEDSTGR
ncbi:hypothetical protein Bbelb_411970 [Branchiostoma belcheri]|nr:hypothetical protein Bbelb_411970 [Branchiostoma belcheri]